MLLVSDVLPVQEEGSVLQDQFKEHSVRKGGVRLHWLSLALRLLGRFDRLENGWPPTMKYTFRSAKLN